MSTTVLVLRLVLAVVFVTAGVGKLLDLEGSRQAVADFGVPKRLAAPVGTLLPLAELAAGIALLFVPTARWGALLALLLLVAFMVGIGRALARGEQPDCHCFGQIHSAPAGRGTLVRNAVLAVFALVVVAYGSGPAVDTWIGARSAAVLAAIGVGIVAVAAAWYAFNQREEVKRLSGDLRIARRAAAQAGRYGLSVGSQAPPFALDTLQGELGTLDMLLERGRPVVLMFMSPWCGPCTSFLPQVQEWQQTLSERLTIAVISTGTREQNAVFEEHELNDVLLQGQMEVGDMYHVTGTPTGVLISAQGKIASINAQMIQGIEPLVRLALRQGAGRAMEESAA